MARDRWMTLPGGRIKRWRKSDSEDGCIIGFQVPPRWYRHVFNRRERLRARIGINRGDAHNHYYVHPRVAAWYW
jgi:hypothetical protein